MAPDERSRLEAPQALTEQLGPAAAAALMECIPPFGWHEIATKRDLAELERRIDLRFDAVEARFQAVDARFESLEAKLTARFQAVDSKFAALDAKLEAKLHAEITRMIKWTVGAIFGGAVAIGAAATAIAALVR